MFFSQPFENLIAQKLSPPREMRNIPPPPPKDRFSPPFQDKNRPFIPPPRKVRLDIISLFLYCTLWALGLALKINEQWRLSEKKIIQAESEKLNAELSFLKAQINPHFLFNTLNNIYTLALLNHPNTAPSIMKLSHIMRYVTDEVSSDRVPLKDEIEFIEYYISLEKLRLNERTPINFQVKGDYDNKTIPPLILITFIENAFKHGISKRELSPISIQLEITEHSIEFFSTNKFFEQTRLSERVGIGLENTRQRLNQLYPQRHSLQTSIENGNYSVYLRLEF
jgi:LytS/YehU family sensor histidine kinase